MTSTLPRRGWRTRWRHRRRDASWRWRLRRAGLVIPAARARDPAFPDVAVATIAVSPLYHDWCLSMIDSLRQPGGFAGPVYVATEDPTPFDAIPGVYPVVVPPTPSSLVIKTLKPLLHQWLREPRLLFLDADVLVARPLAPWLVESLPALESTPVLTFPDVKPVPGSYHTGVLLSSRERALPLMRRWRRTLRSGRFHIDQGALKSIEDASQLGYFPGHSFAYLNQCIDAPLQPGEGAPACFVHVTKRMIEHHPRAELAGYVREVLGVRRLPRALADGPPPLA